MLAFQMPFDCYEQMILEVWKHGGEPHGEAAFFCDPKGCGEAASGAPCDDGSDLTENDRCDANGHCVGDLPSPTTTTTAKSTTTTTSKTSVVPSTSTTMSTVSASTSTTTTTTARPTTTSRPTTTTTSTLPCRPEAPSACNLDLCQRPKLHRKAKKLARKIQHALDSGRRPRRKLIHKLSQVLEKCGVPIQ